MSGYVVTLQAEQDITEIAAYIAADNRQAAERFVRDCYEAIAQVAERPGIGHSRPDLTSRAVRFWTINRRYMVVYRGDAPIIQILRVLSGYRDLAAILT